MKYFGFLSFLLFLGCSPYKSTLFVNSTTIDCSLLINTSVDAFSKDTNFRSPSFISIKESGVKFTKQSILSFNFVKSGNKVTKYMSVNGISSSPILDEKGVVFLFDDDSQLEFDCKVTGDVTSDFYGNAYHSARAFFEINDKQLNDFSIKKIKGVKLGIATQNFIIIQESEFFYNVSNCFKNKFKNQ
jgi:hypothetical protein